MKIKNESERIIGRKYDDAFIQSQILSANWSGFEPGVSPFRVINLLNEKNVPGWNGKLITYLEWLITKTCKHDWYNEEIRPIVSWSNIRIAQLFGVNETTIWRWNKDLIKLGAISFNDSPNYHRHIKRDRTTKEIDYAYGIDLSPLATLYKILLKLPDNNNNLWAKLKREVSAYKKRIRNIIACYGGDFTKYLELISFKIKVITPIEEIKDLKEKLIDAYKAIVFELNSQQNQEIICDEINENAMHKHHKIAMRIQRHSLMRLKTTILEKLILKIVKSKEKIEVRKVRFWTIKMLMCLFI